MKNKSKGIDFHRSKFSTDAFEVKVTAEDETVRGIITKINQDKGFGFIRGFNDVEYFFHKSELLGSEWLALCRDIEYNDIEVEFKAGNGPKGPRAEKVTRV